MYRVLTALIIKHLCQARLYNLMAVRAMGGITDV